MTVKYQKQLLGFMGQRIFDPRLSPTGFSTLNSVIGWYDFEFKPQIYTNVGATTNVTAEGDFIRYVNDRATRFGSTDYSSAGGPTYAEFHVSSLGFRRNGADFTAGTLESVDATFLGYQNNGSSITWVYHFQIDGDAAAGTYGLLGNIADLDLSYAGFCQNLILRQVGEAMLVDLVAYGTTDKFGVKQQYRLEISDTGMAPGSSEYVLMITVDGEAQTTEAFLGTTSIGSVAWDNAANGEAAGVATTMGQAIGEMASFPGPIRRIWIFDGQLSFSTQRAEVNTAIKA